MSWNSHCRRKADDLNRNVCRSGNSTAAGANTHLGRASSNRRLPKDFQTRAPPLSSTGFSCPGRYFWCVCHSRIRACEIFTGASRTERLRAFAEQDFDCSAWNIIWRPSGGAIDDACLRGVEPPAACDPLARARTARNCAPDMTVQICWSSVTCSRWILPRCSISAILL